MTVALAAVGAVQAPAAAAATTLTTLITSPYSGGGFDISYPQCSIPPSSYESGFYIVGVTDGRPFTSNGCASQEWSDASNHGSTSIYFNTGYAGAYARNIATLCSKAGYGNTVFPNTSRHELSAEEKAWEIGCSEALYATTVIQSEPSPTMYWADVEVGNSWSTNATLNQYTIDGISWEMADTGVGGGIYSSPGMWASITGSSSWGPQQPVSANWLAGGTSPCSTTNTVFGKATTPTWLSQYGTTDFDSTAVDEDVACS